VVLIVERQARYSLSLALTIGGTVQLAAAAAVSLVVYNWRQALSRPGSARSPNRRPQ